jgi:hypothetical protein
MSSVKTPGSDSLNEGVVLVEVAGEIQEDEVET